MSHDGLAKLAEECGELLQVVGKRLNYPGSDWRHPDGGAPLNLRLEDEIADVLAACRFVVEANGLNNARVVSRADVKLDRFREWRRQVLQGP